MPGGLVVRAITYAAAAMHVAKVHRHLPGAPPRVQIRACFGAYRGARLRAVAMLGNPVSPHHNDALEVRRLASDGAWGACSALYLACLSEAARHGKARMVTYIFASESGRSCEIAGGVRVEVGPQGVDTRKGRKNLTRGVRKVRYDWVISGPRPVERQGGLFTSGPPCPDLSQPRAPVTAGR